MLENYSIAETVSVDGKNLQVYFRDNQSPPVFAFTDILTITFKEYGRNVATYTGKISDEHKEKVLYNHCERWVLDFDGMAEFIRTFAEDAEDILQKIKDFVNDVYQRLPSPVVVVKETVDNKTVSIDGVEYEYKVSQFVRWFKIDSFTATCGDKIKSNLKLLDSRDIRDGWISEDGLMDALQIFEDNETLKIFERIIEACDSNDIVEKPWSIDDLAPISFVIDGDKSDSSRYLFKTKDIRNHQVKVVYVILNSEVIVLFYDIKALANILGIDPEIAARAAVKHSSLFFKGKDIFVNIIGVNSILQKLAVDKSAAHSLTQEVCKAFYRIHKKISLKLEGNLVYTTKDVIDESAENRWACPADECR